MADPPPYPDTGDDAGVGPHRGSITGTPRWVKVFGVIALVVIVVFVIALLGGGGGHGPGRHTSSGSAGGTTPSSIAEGYGPLESGTG